MSRAHIRAEEPAYPTLPINLADGSHKKAGSGLTIREAFVMAAMQGIASNKDTDFVYETVARDAVTLADATISAMEAEHGK